MLSDGAIDDIDGSNRTLYIGKITVGNKDTRLIDYIQLYNSELVFAVLYTHEYWWTIDSIILRFRQYTVDKVEEEYHYIVSDNDKEEIAVEFENISLNIANKIRSLNRNKLYNYINRQLINNELARENNV